MNTEYRTARDWRSKAAAAYLEAAKHLEQSWTTNEHEREQGLLVRDELIKKVNECEVEAKRIAKFCVCGRNHRRPCPVHATE